MFLVPDSDDPQAVEVKRLGIRPGDRIVLKLDHEPFEEECRDIESRLAAAFEGSGYVPPVLILSPGAEIGVIGPDEVPQPAGIVRQAALEALLSAGFDPFSARAVLDMGRDEEP